MTRRKAEAPISQAVPGLAARRGALILIGTVLDRGAMLHDSGLTGEPAERAEARGLADLTLRRLGQIDEALGRLVDRMPGPPVRHVLRLMAAELLFAGTAPHAAVDLGVRLVRGVKGGGRFAGLVNAVGRRLAAEGASIVAAQDAARLNAPGWLWKALRADWGEAVAQAMAGAHLAPAPLDLTPRDPAEANALAAELGAELLPTGTLRLAGRPQVSALPGYERGAWWVQDAAAALPARLLPGAGARVLDLCAAPGGKTMQLAAAGARVTALDLSARRMDWLRENLARTGLEAECVVADALDWAPGAPAAPFDAVLIDAPCSATGTVRRHPDLAWRQGTPDLDALTALQARMLDRAAAWLGPGGVLVFCTCSLIRAEGEQQARRFLERTPGLQRLPIAPGEAGIAAEFLTREGDLRTRPDQWAARGGLDGFFAARFRRL
ncbi:MAG TPA: methyltransferase domain-containing protein [Thermohalobaculum sp.]|nr:methyltransferase domain-containing protein [Thermohalobaculum sp.]